MVYAFLIHTLFPGQTKVLFYQIFGSDTSGSSTVASDTNGSSNKRQKCKTDIEYVASQVHSEFQFRRSVAGRTVDDDIQALNQEEQLPQFELGFLRLPVGAPFADDKIVVWLGAGNTCFTLVCYKQENRTLAEHVLKTLIRHLQDYLRVLNQPAEASLKADRVCLILNRFLPDGALVFMNHRVVRGIERELEVLIKT
ncbi:AP5S1-like protein [Mya arenaria]|uniref:AP5S1-like protein n=1 Tax=Mya arenaria TaxID=6604 RepID=A0ABY7FMR3_MYAAR|nr:AP-5 complex subunit sigma-1-like [Mya arenaria]WAR22604.1 AP5S1-like protein [Mya arenaria]